MLYRSTNSGEQWSEVETGLPIGSFIFGCQVINENTFYLAAGETDSSGLVMKTTDGGTTWTKMYIDSTFFLDRVVFLNDLIGFTCGTTEDGVGKILKTTDGGMSWLLLHTTNGLVTSIQCPTEQLCFATVTFLDASGGELLRSTDGGMSWSEQLVPDRDIISNYFVDPDYGYACGSGLILYTTNGGVQWHDAGYTGLDIINYVQPFEGGALAVGSNGTILKYETPASVQRDQATAATAYPNPAKATFYIEAGYPNVEKQIILFDQLGRMVGRQVGIDPVMRFDRQELANGMYHYRIATADGLQIAKRMITFK
jgi:photosystem II stability/assembly factor-like uncharacterized protein